MSELTGKLAMVTGASRGIGAGIAIALADEGADLVITYERSTERASALVRAIEQKGRRAFALQADSADAAAVKHSVEEAAALLGGLDILVNNAGIARVGAFTDLNLAAIDAMLNVNVRAAVLASQAAIRYMREGGRIVTIGSNVSQRVPFGLDGVCPDQDRTLCVHVGASARARAAGHYCQPGATGADRH